MDELFKVGEVYSRIDIHSKYGGQRQGGISTPKQFPVILLFTGESGEPYGYKDGWTDEGVFLYSGEGQTGDMPWMRGNLAIAKATDAGKDIHLFKYAGKGLVKYLGQMLYQGYEIRDSLDINKQPRKAIVFKLEPLGKVITESENINLKGMPLSELREKALADASETAAIKVRQTISRQRSASIKTYVLKRANGICEGCAAPAPFIGLNDQPYLEPHHIRRLSDGGPDHPECVAAVCPNCHTRAHYSKDRDSYNKDLGHKVNQIEKKLSGSYNYLNLVKLSNAAKA
jgi:5-methylcytosine-specific restriction protein A